MLRKVFRTGNSVVVSLPREVLEYLNIHEGVEIEVNLIVRIARLIFTPVETPLAISGVDRKICVLVAEFIEEYCPALEELANFRDDLPDRRTGVIYPCSPDRRNWWRSMVCLTLACCCSAVACPQAIFDGQDLYPGIFIKPLLSWKA